VNSKITNLLIREIKRNEYPVLGELMVEVYSQLDGFPSPIEQPKYYETLMNIGCFNEKQETKVLVAISPEIGLVGGIVYFSDMSQYGSGGTAPQQTNASGIRLLGVYPKAVGKALTNTCIQFAKDKGHKQVILHTTQAMQVAWKIYTKIGFQRSPDLDFTQEQYPIYGFRLNLCDD
jgi:GNAT superfamily N-acetyltransferase